MQLFPDPKYTEQEMAIIKKAFSEPLVIRYLRGLAQVAATDVATSYDRITEDPVMYQAKNAFLKGSIATLSDLVDLAELPQTK